MYTVVLTIHILLAIFITIFVLMQRSEGGALGALGGGQGAAGLFTGRQAGNFLTKATTYLFVAFIITSLSLVIMAKKVPVETAPSIMPVQSEQPVE